MKNLDKSFEDIIKLIEEKSAAFVKLLRGIRKESQELPFFKIDVICS